ncbi:prepilin peptidase [Methylorubrum sp. POS3]|uniref:A24 family peptidase n=1 Tax=Methylorubrum sp. POS3 TaxID=2998492 RepID=UPI00372C4D20
MAAHIAGFLLCVLFPFLLAYAAASDLLTMKISNKISLFLVAGFALYGLASGMTIEAMSWHAAAGAFTLAVAFGLFALNWVGGGDAKLAAGIALWFGFANLADFLFVASLAGGALTLAILYIRMYPLPLATLRLPFAVRLHDSRTGIPYGIALASAALFVAPETMIWKNLLLI